MLPYELSRKHSVPIFLRVKYYSHYNGGGVIFSQRPSVCKEKFAYGIYFNKIHEAHFKLKIKLSEK